MLVPVQLSLEMVLALFRVDILADVLEGATFRDVVLRAGKASLLANVLRVNRTEILAAQF